MSVKTKEINLNNNIISSDLELDLVIDNISKILLKAIERLKGDNNQIEEDNDNNITSIRTGLLEDFNI